MTKTDRLFQITQYLRSHRQLTAAQLASWLEVSQRTIYRDIQRLMMSGVPVLKADQRNLTRSFINLVDVFYDETQAVAGGCQSGVAQEDLIKVVSQSDFAINIDLHLGEGKATVYTCNCTEEYVRINY